MWKWKYKFPYIIESYVLCHDKNDIIYFMYQIEMNYENKKNFWIKLKIKNYSTIVRLLFFFHLLIVAG